MPAKSIIDVAEAYAMVCAGQKLEIIADHFGVSHQSICERLRRAGHPTSAQAYKKTQPAGPVSVKLAGRKRKLKHYDPAEVLARITAAPIKFVDLAGGSKQHHDRKALRTIVDRLVAQEIIKLVWIDRFPYYVLADWKISPQMQLEIIESRARRDKDGCLVWAQYTSDDRGPMVPIDAIPTPVRRLVWETKKGVKLGWNDTIKPACGNWACIEFNHMEKADRADNTRGRPLNVAHKLKIAQSMRENSKLSPELVEEIRCSKETVRAQAARLGINKCTVMAIRKGIRWKEYGNGLFTGLVAAGMDLPKGRRAA